MAVLELQAEPRSAVGKGLRGLRESGYIPAVLYGHGLETVSLQVQERALGRILDQGGSHGLISLSVTDDSEQYTVLAREVQRHPTKSQVLHVDFYRVLMSETMQATVPVVIVGKSPAVTNNMAALVQSLDSIQVECLPGDLPDAFEVDISILERTDQNILLGDLVVPEGVTILDDAETVLFSLAAARAIEEEEEEEEELLYGAPEEEEVEVMAKGKAASEEGEWEEEA